MDPEDFDAFRQTAHELLDHCIDHLQSARERPWRPLDDAEKSALMPELPTRGIGESQLATELSSSVLPFGTGSTHPRFFGWVHGTGLAAGFLAEMTAAAMNSNCGGRDHGAIYAERAVIDWSRRIFGFPDGASGILTTGTSQATVLALAAARTAAAGRKVREEGVHMSPQLTAYCGDAAHSAIQKAMELLGHGSAALRRIPANAWTGGMDIGALNAQIDADISAGHRPFCVIGTAGSVDTAGFDDLARIADLCEERQLWFHIDGAFGAWARIAEDPWRELTNGLERADSLAFDFHKWMYVQYDCGAVLMRDGAVHHATFAMRPAYLKAQEAGIGGGDPWYCDYGIDLSRGFRALKVWAALRAYGIDRLGASISDNCRQAARMAQRVEAEDELELAVPVSLNICCFRFAPAEINDETLDKLNARIAVRLQIDGDAVFSTTRIDRRLMLRAAIVNHRTRAADIDAAIDAVLRAGAREISELS